MELTQSQKFILMQLEQAKGTIELFEQAIKTGQTNIMQERLMSSILSKFNSQK